MSTATYFYASRSSAERKAEPVDFDGGGLVPSWKAVQPRFQIKADNWDGLEGYAGKLKGCELNAGEKFALIVREEVFARLKPIRLRHCAITRWTGAARGTELIRRAWVHPPVSEKARRRAEAEPFVRDVLRKRKSKRNLSGKPRNVWYHVRDAKARDGKRTVAPRPLDYACERRDDDNQAARPLVFRAATRHPRP